MADEATLNGTFTVAKNGVGISQAMSITDDVTGTDKFSTVIATSTTAAAVSFPGGFGTPGWAWFYNMDDTDTIILGKYTGATFYEFAEIPPLSGYAVKLAMASTELGHKSSANTPNLYLEIMEE